MDLYSQEFKDIAETLIQAGLKVGKSTDEIIARLNTNIAGLSLADGHMVQPNINRKDEAKDGG